MTSFASSSEVNFLQALRSLGRVPPALPWEAWPSWICRLALAHGCTAEELLRLMKVDVQEDPDFQLAALLPNGIGHIPRLRNLEFGRALMLQFSRSRLDPRRFLLFAKKSRFGSARYRFCVLCMRGQRIASIPLHCRFAGVRYCPEHLCLLEDACWKCGAELILPGKLDALGSTFGGAESLDQCSSCLALLHEVEPLLLDSSFLNEGANWRGRWLRNGVAAIAALAFDRVVVGSEVFKASHLEHLDRLGILPNNLNVMNTKRLRKLHAARADGATKEQVNSSTHAADAAALAHLIQSTSEDQILTTDADASLGEHLRAFT